MTTVTPNSAVCRQHSCLFDIAGSDRTCVHLKSTHSRHAKDLSLLYTNPARRQRERQRERRGAVGICQVCIAVLFFFVFFVCVWPTYTPHENHGRSPLRGCTSHCIQGEYGNNVCGAERWAGFFGVHEAAVCSVETANVVVASEHVGQP